MYDFLFVLFHIFFKSFIKAQFLDKHMKKSIFLILVLCTFLIFLPLNVEASSMGLRSNDLRVTMNFEPNFEKTYYYSVLSFGDEIRDIETYAKDDNTDGTISNISQYFIFDKQILKNVGPKNEPYFAVTVKLPNKINEPGTHIVHVGAVEHIENNGGFGVRTGIEALFYIYVAFDGQYLRYSFSAESVNQGKPIPIHLGFTNLGNQPINALNANVNLIDFNKQTAASIKTETIELGKQESKTIEKEISTITLLPGQYLANATINYDGNVESSSFPVKIGELNVKIINQTYEMLTGLMNKFFVEVESQWANKIKGVYAEIKIGNSEIIKTVSEDIEGFQAKKLETFFDATNIAPGDYDATITLHFEDRTITKKVKIKIVRENVLELVKANMTLANILFLIILAIIIIINLILFFIVLRKKDEHEKQR